MINYQDVILFVLSKANQKVYATFKSRLVPYNLTPVQALVLHALYDEEGISSGELGKRLGLDSATLSGVLDRMEENEWIIRNAFKEDKRVVNIFLMEKSHQIRNRFLKETSELNQEILSVFSMEERLLFVRMLKDLRK